jgi:hypothetical protein
MTTTDQDVQETPLSVFRHRVEGYKKDGENTIVTLKPSTESLASLGVPTAQIRSLSNLISPDSAYRKLPRPATLPHCTFSAKNEDAQKAALKLWNGDFVVGYLESEDRLELSAGFDDEDVAEEFRGPLINVTLKRRVLQNQLGAEMGSAGMGSNTSGYVPRFGAALYEKHKHTLVCRVLHHFIRQHGFMLIWTIVEMALVLLESKYKNKNKKYLEPRLDT